MPRNVCVVSLIKSYKFFVLGCLLGWFGWCGLPQKSFPFSVWVSRLCKRPETFISFFYDVAKNEIISNSDSVRVKAVSFSNPKLLLSQISSILRWRKKFNKGKSRGGGCPDEMVILFSTYFWSWPVVTKFLKRMWSGHA